MLRKILFLAIAGMCLPILPMGVNPLEASHGGGLLQRFRQNRQPARQHQQAVVLRVEQAHHNRFQLRQHHAPAVVLQLESDHCSPSFSAGELRLRVEQGSSGCVQLFKH